MRVSVCAGIEKRRKKKGRSEERPFRWSRDLQGRNAPVSYCLSSC
jgi:hypothetical protein